MPRKILIVPDKFKGTLTAPAAAEAIAQGWRAVRPDDALELLPMSDGGDGFGEVMGRLLQAQGLVTLTVDAAHRPRQAKWWWFPQTKTAIVETAQAIGLALLPAGKFHPFDLDTLGLGALFLAARESGAESILVGIGGSATNDGGFGLARAMGWQFFDTQQRLILKWTGLSALARVQPPAQPLRLGEVVVAVDVQNPLVGARGATRVYGPQKGLETKEFSAAEDCLERMAAVVRRDLVLDCAAEPGAGAAGGLGYGLRAFLNARLDRGFEIFARHANLDERIRSVSLVITGEGAIDTTSLMGKGVGEIASRCRKFNVPCVALVGAFSSAGFYTSAEAEVAAKKAFTLARAIVPELASAENSKAEPAVWLAKLAEQAGREWSSNPNSPRW